MKPLKLNAKVKVQATTRESKYALNEIHGIKEGDVLMGKLSEDGTRFHFKVNGEDAVLFVDENCTILMKEEVMRTVWKGQDILEEFEYEDAKGAKEYAESVHGTLAYSVAYYDVAHDSYPDGFYYSTTLADARKSAYKGFIN